MSTLDHSNDFIDEKAVGAWPISSRYGLFTGLVLVVLALVVQLAGLVDFTDQNSASNWISTLVNLAILTTGMIMAVNKHRAEELDGYVSYGRAFLVGFLVTLVAALISAVWAYLFFAFVDPSVLDTMLEAAREQMFDQGLSEAEVDRSMSITSWFFKPPIMAVFGAVSTIFMGTILALIVAAFTQRRRPGA